MTIALDAVRSTAKAERLDAGPADAVKFSVLLEQETGPAGQPSQAVTVNPQNLTANASKAQAPLAKEGADQINLLVASEPTLQANPQDQPETLSDTRRQQIDNWLANNDHATGGFWIFGQTSAAEHISDALKGNTELGALSRPEQRYLVDRALERIDFSDVNDLAGRVQDDGTIRGVVAEGLANRAAQFQSRPAGNGSYQDPHMQARAYALNALEATRGDDQGLGQVISQLTPQDGALFAQALGNGAMPDSGLMSGARDQVLSALNSVPHTDATSAVVQNIFAQTWPIDTTLTPQLSHNMATALAREWYPENAGRAAAEASRLEGIMNTHEGAVLLFGGSLDRNVAALAAVRNSTGITADVLTSADGDPARNPAVTLGMASALVPADAVNREATVNRISGILQTDQGQRLFFGSRAETGDQVPIQARMAAQQAILSDPSITAETLGQSSDPWTNPAILTHIAQANDADFRRDAPAQLTGSNLDNTLGIAMGMPASLPSGISEQQAWAQVSAGALSLYAQGEGHDAVQAVVNQIRAVGGDNPIVTVLPVTYSSGDRGPIQLPLFRVQTASGDRFVDNTGRSYTSFQDWKEHNQLPDGLVVYPENGHLQTDENGALRLGSSETPRTGDTAGKILDFAALVGGIIAGGAVILGTGGLGIAIVGVGSAAWGAYRSGEALVDRANHGQSINPIADPAARNLWLSLAANATGVGAFASEAALARLVANGGRLAEGSALVIGAMRTAATIANGAAFTNAGVDLASNWGSMSPDQRATAVLQMGFWGLTSVAAARQARSFGELYNPVEAARAVLDAYQPPVLRDATLEGNRVEIRQDALGRPVIYAGEQATPQDIQAHIDIVRMMARDQGLSGMIQEALGEPAPGTLAYSVKYENIKLGNRINELNAQLNDPNLTAQQRTQIDGDIESIRAYQDQLATSFAQILADPANAVIAAPSTGAARAEEVQPGLVADLQSQYPGYYFRSRGVDELPEIVRSEGQTGPMVALVRQNGQYEIVPVPNQPNTPAYGAVYDPRSISANLAANTLQDIPNANVLNAEFNTLIGERTTLAAQRDAILGGQSPDELTPQAREQYNGLNQQVVDLSRQIGELGAISFVNSEYSGARLIYGGPGQGSRAGDFDLVFSREVDGRTQYIVVEAKGGSSPLGTRRVDRAIETQGTRAYFEDIVASMDRMGGNARDVSIELNNALQSGDVIYITTRAQVDNVNANVSAKQFDIGIP